MLVKNAIKKSNNIIILKECNIIALRNGENDTLNFGDKSIKQEILNSEIKRITEIKGLYADYMQIIL